MRWICYLFFSLISTWGIGQNNFTLQQAIDYAIAHSDQISLDKLKVENADAQVTEYKAIGMPKVSANVDYQYYFKAPAQPVEDFLTPAIYGVLEEEGLVDPFTGDLETFNFSFFQKNNLTAKIEASAMIFDGSYLAGLKAARLYMDLETKSMAITEQEIKANVAKAYTGILIAQENKIMIDKNVNNVKTALNELKEIYKSGFVEQLDVDRLALSFENLKTESDKLSQLISLSKNVLKFQMNYPYQEEIELTENLENVVDLLKVSLVNISDPVDISKRAEIDQIETGQRLNVMNIDRLKKSNLPSVFAFANISESLQRNNLFEGNEVGFLASSAVGLGISLPIYDGGKRTGQVQQAIIEMKKTDIQFDQFKKATSLQIRNARIQYVNAKRTLESREKSLELSEKIYNKSEIKFKEGVGSSVERTQAEASLYEAQANYINALYDMLSAKIEIDIASGQL